MPRCLSAQLSCTVTLAVMLSAAAVADTAAQVFDLNPGPNTGVTQFHAADFGGRLCFRGSNDSSAVDATGAELYCYDGTTVTLAADIQPGGIGSIPSEPTIYGGQLYFSAENPFNNNELWRWDGINPPVQVFDLQPGGESFPEQLTVYDGQLYFGADDGSTGRELWRYDSGQPTAIGTNPMPVADLVSGVVSGLTSIAEWVVFDGILYFPGRTAASGEELFRFDSSQPIVSGTNPGLVADLHPGLPGSQPADLTVHDGDLYFTAVDAASPFEPRLFRFNGVDPPTKLSATLHFQGNVVSYGGNLLFFALDDDPVTGTGNELWSYDGTSFTRVEPGSEYFGGGPFAEIDGFLYYIAAQGNPLSGLDLYKYDGTNPPAPAVDIFSTIGDSSQPADGFLPFAGRLYFSAGTPVGGGELWALEPEGGGPSPSGVIEFGAPSYGADEGASNALVNIFRNGGTTGAISACLTTSDGSATAGADYQTTSTTISFGDGAQAPQTIFVPLLDDPDVEGDETVILTLSTGGPCGAGPIGNPTATLTIVDDDGAPASGTIQFSAATYAVGEGDGVATLTFTRTGGSSGPITACYETTSGGTATLDSDYEGVQGAITFGDGDMAPQSVGTFAILDDPDIEGDETVHVHLLTGQNCTGPLGTPDTAVVTILDDDGAPASGTIQFSTTAYAVGEGDGAATITFTRTGGSAGAIGACFMAVAATATSADFTPVDTGVVFADGATAPQTRTVPILSDADVEGSETVSLLLTLNGFLCSGPLGTPAVATLTILDDDGQVDPAAIPTLSQWGLTLLALSLALLALPRLRG